MFRLNQILVFRPIWLTLNTGKRLSSVGTFSVTMCFKSTNPRTLTTFQCRCYCSSKRELARKNENPEERRIIIHEQLFKANKKRDKSTFLLVLETFINNNTIRRQHIEFIYEAMKHLEEYGVQADLEVYKALMSVFPEGRFVPQNRFQVAFFHFPMHQNCAVDLLDKMEFHGVCPDLEMKKIIVDRFGGLGDVFKKFARMLYWFPKFKHLSPFPLPDPLPNDSLQLAKLAIARMMVDLKSSITVYQTDALPDSLDKTWIVSGQSPDQQELISSQKENVPFYVEGPFFIWLKDFSITYFMLRAENNRITPTNEDEDPDDISNIESVFLNPNKAETLMTSPSLHEQEDGIVLALCATGTSSRDSLLSWIRFLEETNSNLGSNPVLFTLKAPSKDLVTVNQKREEPHVT